MTFGYVLSSAAEADLRDVIRYTQKQWGNAQTRAYVAKLRSGLERIVKGQGVVKDLPDLYPGLGMVHCEHHYIFCLPRKDAPTLVVAIFHERMDLMVRLIDRLK